jgi:hypothetical protein
MPGARERVQEKVQPRQLAKGEVEAREDGAAEAKEEGEVEVVVPLNEEATIAAMNYHPTIAAGYESIAIMPSAAAAAAAAAAAGTFRTTNGSSDATPTTVQQLPSALSVEDTEFAQRLRLSGRITDEAWDKLTSGTRVDIVATVARGCRGCQLAQISDFILVTCAKLERMLEVAQQQDEQEDSDLALSESMMAEDARVLKRKREQEINQ